MTDEELMMKIEVQVKKSPGPRKKRRAKKTEPAEQLFKRLMVEDLKKKGYIK